MTGRVADTGASREAREAKGIRETGRPCLVGNRWGVHRARDASEADCKQAKSGKVQWKSWRAMAKSCGECGARSGGWRMR